MPVLVRLAFRTALPLPQRVSTIAKSLMLRLVPEVIGAALRPPGMLPEEIGALANELVQTRLGFGQHTNYGFWVIDGAEELAFFEHVQRQSFDTRCERCRQPVRLMPVRRICAPCASAMECGAPASLSEYGTRQTEALAQPDRRISAWASRFDYRARPTLDAALTQLFLAGSVIWRFRRKHS